MLPLFALANAGVRIAGVNPAVLLAQPVALGVIVGLLVGKPLGILAMSWLAVRLRVADLPDGVGWAHIAGAGVLGGIGFTMSIFVTGLAFGTTPWEWRRRRPSSSRRFVPASSATRYSRRSPSARRLARWRREGACAS